MKLLETDRLTLRRLTPEDAEFILELLNDPSYIRFIKNRNIRTVDDARDYILSGPIASYERFGFGLYLTELKESGTPIGLCGLIKRDTLDDVDVGYAFLPRFWSKGYAHESTSAVMAYGRTVLGLKRLVAITSQDNAASIKVLAKLGFRLERLIQWPDDGSELNLFVSDI